MSVLDIHVAKEHARLQSKVKARSEYQSLQP